MNLIHSDLNKEEIPATVTEEQTSVELSRMERARKESGEKSSKLFSKFPALIVVLLIIAILLVIWFFKDGFGGNQSADDEVLEDTEIIINNPNNSEKEEGLADQDEEENSETEEIDNEEEIDEEEENSAGSDEESLPEFTVVEEGTGSTPVSLLELKNVGEEIIVTFDTGTRTWLDVKDDQNKALFSSTLEPENSPLEVDLSGTSEIFMNIGNASDLTISVNGVELPYPVDPKQNVHQQLRIEVIEDTEEIE